MPLEELVGYCLRYLRDKGFGKVAEAEVRRMVEVAREEWGTLEDCLVWVEVLSLEEVEASPEAQEVLSGPEAQEVLREAVARLERDEKLDFAELVKGLQERFGFGGRRLFLPLRAALCGRLAGPELVSLWRVLGRRRWIDRLRRKLR